MDAQESTRSTNVKEAELALLLQFAFRAAALFGLKEQNLLLEGHREASRAHFKDTKAVQNSEPALPNHTQTHSRISKRGVLQKVLQKTHLKNDDENRSLPGDVGKKC